MNRFITVTLESTTTTTDDYGDSTSSTTTRRYDRVRFVPRSSSERADQRAPAVITAASLLRRGEFPVNPSDAIVISGQHPHIDGRWQVEGEVGQWASGVEVAIMRAGAS